MPMQTIIECLKQATTGELPPNTRSGQSFIHDPKAGYLSHTVTCFLGEELAMQGQNAAFTEPL